MVPRVGARGALATISLYADSMLSEEESYAAACWCWFTLDVNLVAPCLLRCMDVFGAVNFGWAHTHKRLRAWPGGRWGAPNISAV